MAANAAHGAEEWEDFHRHARNSTESTNSQLKRGCDHNLHSSSRRLVRGFAAAQVMLTMVITAFNIGKTAKFIHDRMHEDATGGPKEPYERARDIDWYNPYTDSYPRGVTPPAGTKRRRQTADGAGGPPPRRVAASQRLDTAREGEPNAHRTIRAAQMPVKHE